MKKLVYLLMIAAAPFVVASCGASDSPEGFADQMCDCFKDNGISTKEDMGKADEETQKKVKECTEKVEEAFEKKAESMTDEEADKFENEVEAAFEKTDCKDLF